MKLIAAAAADWGLGFRGKLLFSIPEDMKFFREKTTDHVVVMGRKTLESFPGGRPLKNRVNVVLTTDPEYQAEGAVIVHSIEEARKVLSRYEDASVYVIGGEKIYRQMLPYCDEAFITRIDAVREADAFLPNLDSLNTRTNDTSSLQDLMSSIILLKATRPSIDLPDLPASSYSPAIS